MYKGKLPCIGCGKSGEEAPRKQTFIPGDFVRLTDPLSNSEVVRIENVDEHGFASWLGGSQNCDMEQIEIKVEEVGNPFTDDLREYTVTLSDRVQEIESDFGVKLYPESAVEWLKRRAEIAEESIARLKDYIKKVCKESSEDIQKLDAENKKLKEELSRCRAANADYLTAKTEAENRAKILEKEVADLKVPESRQNRHLRDELHRVRLECQQAWEKANEEMAENKRLRERIKSLEADLEEGGFNDERNFI